MLLQNKTISIIGGGPGGLTLARLLQLQGVDVKVYERDINKDARVQGSLLDLHEDSGQAAIRAAELFEKFKENYLPGADKTLIVDEKATIQFSDHENKNEDDFGHESFRPEIERGTLRKILLESLKPNTVVWNSQFISMENHGDGWLLHFKNEQNAYADIVIGADGANSKLRHYFTDIQPLYTGITMLEGLIKNPQEKIPHLNSLLNGGKIMAFGKSKCILGGQKGSDSFSFYLSIKVNEEWTTNNGLDYTNKKQLLEWFKKEYQGWSRIWYELIENTTHPLIPRTIYSMPVDLSWKTLGNLTMIGDAAHVMTPFAGEGANMAMLDALELSVQLTSDKYLNLEEAINSYENKMRQRAVRAIQDSLENGQRMHSADALNIMVDFFKMHIQ